MTASEIIALVAAGGALLTAATALRKTSIETHDATVAGLAGLTKELRTELDREKEKRRALQDELTKMASECKGEIASMQARHEQEIDQLRDTILKQARRIGQLENGSVS